MTGFGLQLIDNSITYTVLVVLCRMWLFVYLPLDTDILGRGWGGGGGGVGWGAGGSYFGQEFCTCVGGETKD